MPAAKCTSLAAPAPVRHVGNRNPGNPCRVRFVRQVAPGIGCGTIRCGFPPDIAKEQFAYPAAEQLFKKLEQLSHRSGVSRGVAFEDWLTAMVFALAAETKEGEYLAMIERHKAGKKGQGGADLMGQMFGELVNAMSESDADILGDLFQGAITYGEAGQYFTPERMWDRPAPMTIRADGGCETRRNRENAITGLGGRRVG
jgi:hypothetical protein